MIAGLHYSAPPGCRGFDINGSVSPTLAAQFVEAGFDFAIRYVRQDQRHIYDLTEAEAGGILESGLGLMVVQHVPKAGWVPDYQSGTYRGQIAAAEIGDMLPPGTMIWLDLEGVRPGVPAQATIDYCNAWHSEVAKEGFLPGIYVGFDCGLSSLALFYKLRFTHYWGAYNVQVIPVKRGYQMTQRVAKERPTDLTVDFDYDLTARDRLGGVPVILASDDWHSRTTA